MHIQAGKFKGRKLLGPRGKGTTRPITALAKKSLFGILNYELADAIVLDLFCGTGTLGFEALSHGASRCCFADRDRDAVKRLRQNIETLDAGDQCIVWPGDIVASLAKRLDQLAQPIDIAFVDPPYSQSRQWDWKKINARIFEPLARHLSETGTVVLRMDASVKWEENIAPLETRRVKRYGNMVIALLMTN